jgi:hypothetical protein
MLSQQGPDAAEVSVPVFDFQIERCEFVASLLQRLGISINEDQGPVRLQHLAQAERMSSSTCRAVNQRVAGLGLQITHHLVREYGEMVRAAHPAIAPTNPPCARPTASAASNTFS